MQPLNEQQIQAVIDWMKTWEQLKGSAIPMRFEEDFSKHLKGKEKPPLGLKPKFIHDIERRGEIVEAITRYTEAGLDIPKEWAIEFASYCN